MGLTRSERHNRMMDKVFSDYEKSKKDPVLKSIKKNRVKIGLAHKYMGDEYLGTSKHKALRSRMMAPVDAPNSKGYDVKR